MNTIKQFLDFITPEHDKLKHFYLGCVITVLSFILYLITEYIFTLLLPSMIVGVAIEIYQGVTKTGKLEALDVLYTILPSWFVYWVILTLGLFL